MLTFSLQLSTKKSDVEHILEQKTPLVRRKVDRTAQKRWRTLRFLHTEPSAVRSDSENRHQIILGTIEVGDVICARKSRAALID
jgi:hypothetical protein